MDFDDVDDDSSAAYASRNDAGVVAVVKVTWRPGTARRDVLGVLGDAVNDACAVVFRETVGNNGAG